ncbi:MAG: exodeoxyribonuclease VII large subunit [bacterium]|nr:exodeoxyribonuclease VII large subunit [bacterium]
MDKPILTEFKPLTVTELAVQIKSVLETSIPHCWVEGELSNVTYATSGHVYCTLKDANAQMKCVVWRSVTRFLPFRFENGQKVIVFGSIQVYEPRGEYQFIIEQAITAGIGFLQQQFEILKKRLSEEGLFDATRKRSLPEFPKRIAIVTSPTGAAIEDMMRILRQQWKMIEVVLAGVKVQGEGAAEEIANAIFKINQYCGENAPDTQKVDVIIVGRGGGSLEDLWAFNEEVVVRAIANSKIPIVSAVGHEIDYSLSDFAADVRAPTPTAAAQLVVPDAVAIHDDVENYFLSIKTSVQQKIKNEREKLYNLAKRGSFTRPLDRLNLLFQRIDELDHRSRMAMKRIMENLKSSVNHLVFRIEALNPLRLLARGFAVVHDKQGKMITSVNMVQVQEEYSVSLSDGIFRVICKEKLFGEKND